MYVINHLIVFTASPIITLQPASHTFKYNKRNVLAFEIVATGVGQIEYMWQKYNPLTDSWIPVSGRAINDTSPTLNFSVITEEDQGMYHCIVSNYDGNVTSDNATITVFGRLQYSMVKMLVVKVLEVKNFGKFGKLQAIRQSFVANIHSFQ